MREILFRGKDIAGNWHYGDLINLTKEIKQICNHTQLEHAHSINPETVGQYTGLTVNGKKIFEGDIIKYEDKIGYVIYDKGCYCVQDIHSQNKPAIDIVIHNSRNNLEVISNIYDNLELLKGGEG